MQGQFLQFMADNIDHNTLAVDGLNTLHGMGMIKAVTPGIECISRIIPCVEVTVEDVAVAKVDIMLKGSISNMKNFQKLAKMIILGTLIYFGSYHVCFTLQLQPGMVLMQLDHHGEYPGESSIYFLPMIDTDHTNESCAYLTLHFVANRAKIYGMTPVLTFDQPLWMKVQHKFDAEPSTSRIKNVVLGDYT